MALDREDRLFIKEVGKKAARVLKTKNLRLWNEFKRRCDENGESPESVLGNYLYRFAKSILDEDGEFAEDLIGRTIRISALARKEGVLESLDEIIAVKKKLEDMGSSKIDKLIEKMIEVEISKAAITPMDMIRGGASEEKEGAVVLDENTLASLPPEQLELLEQVIRKVKEEKVKAMEVSADKIEEVIEGGEKEEVEYSEDGEDDNRSGKGVEDTSEGD